MLQIKNNTPFETDMLLCPNEHAIDTLYLITKATFNIDKKLTLAKQQLKPVKADEYWEEPGRSSIKYASDFHVGKNNSDIQVIGHAFSPVHKITRQLDVSVRVGQLSKKIRVFGNRHWNNGCISEAQEFKTIPLVYEKAYGGAHIIDGKISGFEQRNPVGIGYIGNVKSDETDGLPLPNLEDPDNLIVSIKQNPGPVCFGVSAPQWLPRQSHCGTYDEKWKANRAPYLPDDFDKRFNNSAHPDLVYSGFLKGGEEVEITNMHPKHTIKFAVPVVNVVSDINMAGKSYKPGFNIETLIIEPDKLLFSMVWRASLECDKKALQISDINIKLQR